MSDNTDTDHDDDPEEFAGEPVDDGWGDTIPGEPDGSEDGQ